MPIRPSAPHAGRTAGILVDRPGTAVAEPAVTPASPSAPGGAAADRPHPVRRVVDRRTAFRLAGGGAAGALAVAAVAGCADEPIYLPDPLAAQEVSARADAAAASAAIALTPQRQAALTTIAAQRTEHAEALRAEIDRVIGVYGDGTTPVHRTAEPNRPAPGSGGPAQASTAQTPPVAPQSVDQLRAQLTRSQAAAAELARTQTGYRAGLLASISAACATQTGVLLA